MNFRQVMLKKVTPMITRKISIRYIIDVYKT